MKFKSGLAALALLALTGCDRRESEPRTPATPRAQVSATERLKTQRATPRPAPTPPTVGGLQPGREYDITRKAELRDGAGETFTKKINQKTSDILKTVHYMSVDTSVTVKLLQVKDEWAEVQITQPEHLAATHRGWIPKECIKGGASSNKLEGWIKHTCRVYQGQSTASKIVGQLSPPASVGVADEGRGWMRLIHGPIKAESTDAFVDNPDFNTGLYIEAANFTTTIPGNWVK